MLDELLRSIVEHLTKKTMFYGFYRYRVISQTEAFELGGGGTGGDMVTLQAASKLDGLPGLVSLPKNHGLAGTTEHLAPSTLVLVGFEGGNPGAPFVCHVLPGQALPLSITIGAVDTIDASSGDVNVDASDTANIIAGTAVYIGGDEMKPAAVGTLTDARLATLLNAVNSIAVVVGVPTTPPLGSVTSDKVYITTGSGKPVDPHDP
ncbi:MAG: hypothetical protein ACMG6S_20580 [Byssovorax sp.]